ncbi:MAG: sulfite exporter TauE/SafE family protein [Oligoflexia bacterium]|nr:sulfite exporter TauE/SafE family protein [Oligoflexia bacterium]
MSLLSILIASFLGSLHCAAMCGGFAAFCGGQRGAGLTLAAVYNLGRLVTYVSLGLFAGFVGERIDQLGASFGLPRSAAIVLGALLVFWGLIELVPVLQRLTAPLRGKIHQSMFRMYERVAPRIPGPQTAFIVGLLSTLLPCAWLYGFVALAASSGSMLGGAATMLFFWFGTLPMMLAMGTVARGAINKFGAAARPLSALLVVAAGLLSISGHFEPMSHHHHQHIAESQG